MSSAAAAPTRAFGIDRGLPFPLADIATADVILLVGANPADTMPPAMQWFDEGRSRGATHITIDPRRSPTARGSKLSLQPVPGTDLALANGLVHLVIRHGHIDTDYIADRACGYRENGRFMQYYRENAKWLERSYDFVSRIGLAELQAIVVTDRDGIVRRLDEAMQRSVDAYRDPWQEHRQPVTEGQFRDALPQVELPEGPLR